MVTSSSKGTTAKSCARSTAKLARPVAVRNRFWRESTSTTMAVDDKARLKPMIVAASAVLPSSQAARPITAPEMAICRPPRAKT
jgi:hypothetical protein